MSIFIVGWSPVHMASKDIRETDEYAAGFKAGLEKAYKIARGKDDQRFD